MTEIDPLTKTGGKKKAYPDTRKALEVVPTIGGGTAHSLPIITDADKFILMQFQCIIFAVWRRVDRS
ncbi:MULTISPECIES: hypothetical protein [Pseudomonas]|uniref:hypothetical protein n=1 Tax=Pseudomonas TaxID=286 RepID=UPI0011B0EBA4|nr:MULTISPECIES: hypothetical protein [Pseudomonas]WLG53587.1 hypothetical protein PSH64_14100 [Pseudomonas sp. FP1742]